MAEALLATLELGDLPIVFVHGDKSLQDAGNILLASLEVSEIKKVTHGDCDEVGSSGDQEESLLAQLVGLDTEWRPERFRNESRTSILQVALKDQVFLFDLISLCKSQCASDLDNLLRTLLTSPRAIKVGTDFRGDLIKLQQSYPNLRCFDVVEPYVELQAFHSSLHPRFMTPSFQSQIADATGSEKARLHNLWQSHEGKKGLTWLVAQYLGKQLDKTECMSDWAARPLSNSQLSYAALDAHSQIDLYSAMTKLLQEGDLPRGARPFALTSKMTVELDTPRFAEYPESEKEGDLDDSPLPEEGAVVKISGCVVDIRFEDCSRTVPPNTPLEVEINGQSIELETTEEQLSADVVRAVPAGGFLGRVTTTGFEDLEVGATVRVLPKVTLPDYDTWEHASPPRGQRDGAQSAGTSGRVESPLQEASASWVSPSSASLDSRHDASLDSREAARLDLRQKGGTGEIIFSAPLSVVHSRGPALATDYGPFASSPGTSFERYSVDDCPSTPVTPPSRSLAPVPPHWQTQTPDLRDHISRLQSPVFTPGKMQPARGRKRNTEDFVSPPRSHPSPVPFQARHIARQLFSPEAHVLTGAQEPNVLIPQTGVKLTYQSLVASQTELLSPKSIDGTQHLQTPARFEHRKMHRNSKRNA
ncbi:hypothetical protein KFL_004550120 [Klebsormidium nitens]|uniref:3'-5' exonuclease domain-containing protein n=1 Tax=Klebsormidium nitens TaxID=105231 RepID=A0A1Y1II43_KLENI|nr:hypothetical protein KFL_004550120 [Klebsormidium nitens]|eukprot:GAQ88741.1 hypothetical protein KFL_004550120 [Klebsormidium nitens]